jgi:hypothetical protein
MAKMMPASSFAHLFGLGIPFLLMDWLSPVDGVLSEVSDAAYGIGHRRGKTIQPIAVLGDDEVARCPKISG